jgi:hypothetical protein
MVAKCNRREGLLGSLLRVVACVAAAALAGCVTDDRIVKSGSWKIDQRLDRVTGTPTTGAFTLTTRSSNSIRPLAVLPASLQLTCFENRPIAKFAFEFKIGTDRNTSLGYRFDDKPGHDAVESRVLLGYQVIVIEDPAALQQFIADLRGSAQLFMRIRSLNAGLTAAEFKVDGAEQAIDAAYASCPLPPDKQRRTT